MKKFFGILILSLFVFSAEVFAADVWFNTTYSRDGERYDWYLVTESIEENFDDKEFFATVKTGYNGERAGGSKLFRFRLVDGVWYAKHKFSSNDFVPVNDRDEYKKMFDACIPYCKLAQTYPR